MNALATRVGHLADVRLTEPDRLDVTVVRSDDDLVAKLKERFDEALKGSSMSAMPRCAIFWPLGRVFTGSLPQARWQYTSYSVIAFFGLAWNCRTCRRPLSESGTALAVFILQPESSSDFFSTSIGSASRSWMPP